MTMISWKSAILGGLAGACMAGIHSVPAFAQEGMTAPPAAVQKFRREDVQAMMTKVSQEVWQAKPSGPGIKYMQERFLDGQRDYFKGDYDSAMRAFVAAEEIFKLEGPPGSAPTN